MTAATTAGAPAPSPRLIDTRVPSDPTGLVLVVHGGGGRGTIPVSPHQLSVLRMVPIAARIARAGHGRLAVFRLLNAVRGFGTDPLSNVRWALHEIGQRYPGVPISVVGHSLGGSVALAAAGSPGLVSVVALAPWLGGSESVRQLEDVPALIVHGTSDRVTSCPASHAYAERARSAGAPVSFVRVERGEHSMLRRLPVFDVLAARYVTATLDGADPAAGARRRSRVDRLVLAARDTPGDYSI